MQYDSLFSVSKAIAEKMGADSTKKYDSTYSVALEILNRMGSTGGGSSILESVSEFPTEGVKTGDVVFLKRNVNTDDGFYAATVSSKDGLTTWHKIVDDNIGVIKTDSLNNAIKYDYKLFLKKDDDGYNKIYGKYHSDAVIDKPMQYETNYYEATLNITDSDWQANANSLGSIIVTIIVPSISQNNECKVRFVFDNNLNMTPSIDKEYVDIFDIQNEKEFVYKIVYKSDNSLFCKIYIIEDLHRIKFYSGTRDTNPFNFKNNSIVGTNLNPLDLSQSEGVKENEKESVSQYMPYLDKDGNIIEDGKKLSEKYNPYNTTTASYGYLNFPRWNKYGQIIDYRRCFSFADTFNGKSFFRISSSNNTAYTWFAPETGGTSGQVLQSNGNAAPIWTDLIKIQKITQDAYDALETKDDNVLYVITNETV